MSGPGEYCCPRCDAQMSGLMPPSDGPEADRCSLCGVEYWPADGKRHVPPREKYRVGTIGVHA